MIAEIPQANPFRFQLIYDSQTTKDVDFINNLPTFANMGLNVQYQAGIFTTEPRFYPVWKINEEIAIQVQTPYPYEAKIYQVGSSSGTTMAQSDITPGTWSGFDVTKYTYTPTSAGFYYIVVRWEYDFEEEAFEADARSDVFYVTEDMPTEKNIIEIQFYSDENKNGFVFDQYYKAYYNGQFKIAAQQRNSSIFDEDTINLLKTKSRSKRSVTLTDIHHAYYDVIAAQLENGTIKLNGEEFICQEPPEPEYQDKSDLVNITFELTAKYDNKFINIS